MSLMPMQRPQPLRKLFRWLALILLGLLIVAGVGIALFLRASLPQLDGERHLAGLTAPVMISRDALGIADIEARSRIDASFALGFVHAQERYFEMDLMRRLPAGELSALVGAAAVEADLKNRRHRFRARAEAGLAGFTAEERAGLDRYRDGVNAGLTSLRARPWEYALLGVAPEPWKSEDSLLLVDAMYLDLNGDNEDELSIAQMSAVLPPGWTDFLIAPDAAWEAPLLGEPVAAPVLPGTPLPRLAASAAPVAFVADADAAPGSNSFAVAGTLTESGAAIVANDMHLGLRAPNIWFRARIRYPDTAGENGTRELNGFTLPGAPILVAGSNGRIAWGFTNSYGDWQDWVRVLRDPANPAQYKVPEGWATIERHEETIAVKGAAARTLVVEDTRWGPILAKDVDGTPLALAWTAYSPRANNLTIFQLERTDTVAAALDLAPTIGIPPQNFLVGDREGHIGWTITGNVLPRRAGFDPQLPADWSRPGTGWVGFVEAKDYPRIENPTGGRLWTANNRTVDGAALDLLGNGGHALGVRALTIRDDLRGRERFAPADLQAIQLDDRSRLLDRWHALLRSTLENAPADDANLQVLAKATASWGGHAAIDSVDYRIVHAFREKTRERVLAPVLAAMKAREPDFELPHRSSEAAVWTLVSQQPAALLDPRWDSWKALLLDAAKAVADDLAAQSGGITAATWGKQNVATIRHPLSPALPPLLTRWLDMPADALAGDTLTPRVTAPKFGASERFAIMPGHESSSLGQMPGGQSDHPLSPFHGAGHADWVQGNAAALRPGAAAHRLVLQPQ